MTNTLEEFYDSVEKIIRKLRQFGFHKWSQTLENDMVAGAMAGEILSLLRQDLIRLLRSPLSIVLNIREELAQAIAFTNNVLTKNQFDNKNTR